MCKSTPRPAAGSASGPAQQPAAAMVSTLLAIMKEVATDLPPRFQQSIGTRSQSRHHSVLHRQRGSGIRRRQIRSRRPSGAAYRTSTTRRCMVRSFPFAFQASATSLAALCVRLKAALTTA